MIDMLFAHTAWAARDRREREACDAFLLDIFGAQTGFEILMSPDREGLGLAREESLMVVSDTMLLPIAARSGGEGADADYVKMLTQHARDTMWIGLALRVKELRPVEELFERHGLKRIYRPGMEHIFFVSDRDETLGMRLEILAQDLPNDPRLQSDWDPTWWRDHHPLGIEGSQSAGLSVASLDEARRFMSNLGFPEVAQRRLEDEPADCAIFQVGEILVEAMCPTTTDSPLAQHLREVQGQYCLTFKVKSLAAAADYLRGKGLTLLGDINHRFLIDPAEAFSRRFYFTQDDIPGDPRAAKVAVFAGERA